MIVPGWHFEEPFKIMCRVSAACVEGVALYEFGGGATYSEYVIQQCCIMYIAYVCMYIYNLYMR